MGGVGKTELAFQYTNGRYQQEYDEILWFDCRDRDLAGEILQFFQFKLKYQIPEELRGQLLSKQVGWCWDKYKKSKLYTLIIVDDVSDVKQLREVFPEDLQFPIVITTRQQHLDTNRIKDLPLDVLSPDKEPEKALELLQLLLGQSDRRVEREPEVAAALFECLGYLPLGIILVGGYLAADPDLSLAVMERQLQAEKLANPALEGLDPAQRGVRAAFALTWVRLTPHAQKLGKLLSLFAPKQIAWDLVVRVTTESETGEGEKQLVWLEEEINEAKKQLYQRHIIQLAEGKQVNYQVHSLVRWFLQEQLRESAEIHSVLATIFINVMVALAQSIPETPTSENIRDVRDDVIHLEELAQSLFTETQQENKSRTIYLDFVPDEQVFWIFTGVGRFYQGQGLYKLAEPWREKSVQVCKFFFTGDHPDVANSLDNLALLYNNQGRYGEAETISLQALRMNQRLFKGDHPDVAISLNNLGLLYNNQGRYGEAETFYLQALRMNQRLFKGDHLAVAKNLDNLAVLYKDQGRYPEAETFSLQALQMIQHLYEGDHPDVAISLHNLAALYYDQGRYPEAEPLYLQVLQMYQRLYEGDHPNVAKSLNNLGLLYYNQGRYPEAEPLYLQALQMYQRLYEGNHLDVADSLNNLAALYYNQERYPEAEPLYLQALQMIQCLYEGDHPYVASSLSNLAVIYYTQGRYSEAEPLYLQALQMRKRLYEGDHLDVADSLNNLALLYDNQGRYPEAEPLYLQALEMRQRLYEGDHPDIAMSWNNLALLFSNQGRYSQAEPLYLQALEMNQRILGLDHPSTITVQDNLKLLRRQLTTFALWKRRLGRFLGILLGIVILPFYLLWLLVKQVWNFVFR